MGKPYGHILLVVEHAGYRPTPVGAIPQEEAAKFRRGAPDTNTRGISAVLLLPIGLRLIIFYTDPVASPSYGMRRSTGVWPVEIRAI